MDDLHIGKILKGDHNSFRYFIETYKSFAFSMSYAILKDKVLAEEAVQESFVRAFYGLASFKRESKFQTWLGKIVINESFKRRKRRLADKQILLADGDTEITVVNDSLERLTLEDQKQFISRVFELLSPHESLALELFYLKENNTSEIAEMTGWSVSKIKMLLLRGRRNFYSQLKMILKSEIKEIV